MLEFVGYLLYGAALFIMRWFLRVGWKWLKELGWDARGDVGGDGGGGGDDDAGGVVRVG